MFTNYYNRNHGKKCLQTIIERSHSRHRLQIITELILNNAYNIIGEIISYNAYKLLSENLFQKILTNCCNIIHSKYHSCNLFS